MSESSSPLGPLFRTPRTLVDRTIDTQETINRRGLDLTRQAVKPLAGAIAGERDAERQVDDTIDQLDETQAELLDEVQSVAVGTIDTTEDAAEWGLDVLEGSVGRLQEAEETTESRAEEALDAAEEAVEELADATEEAVDETADSAEAAADAATDAVADLQAELDDAADEFDAFEAVDESAVEGLVEDGVETLSDLAGAQAEAVADAADTTEAQAEELIEAAVEREGESLSELEGIGETYSRRLAADGVRTVDQLARTSAAEVAEVTGVDEDRAAEWVQRAQDEA